MKKPVVLFSVAFLTMAQLGLAAFEAGAAEPKSSGRGASMSPDALGAKAFLEGLLVRRYTLELATLVDRESFTLGAQMELTPVAPLQPVQQNTQKSPESEVFNDLMLGTIDADQLMKSVASPVDDRTIAQKFMENFKIRSVVVSVGLKDSLNPTVKSEVEGWLKKRLTSEFGSSGKGVVAVIKRAPDKPEKVEKAPTNLLEWAIQYQNLAGQALFAAAIVIGVILWQLLSKIFGTHAGAGAEVGESALGSMMGSSAEDGSDFASLAEAAKELQAEQEQDKRKQIELDEKERFRTGREIESLKSRLRDLMPRLAGTLEEVIRQWCNMGDAGRLRLVCFAEAAYRDTGKLPIPVDALPEVQKIFARMPEIDPGEKRDALEKAYWDLLSTLNLGSDSLTQPFSYMENLSLNTVQKVLVDQNPKLRTIVSLYMSNDMRVRYVRSLSENAKKELLAQAGDLHEIRADELESLDRGLMGRINPTLGKEVVSLDMSFNKIVEALTPIEEITMLANLKSRAIEEYKRTKASLAFLGDWPDDKLRLLMMGITPDELISYLRVRPDLKDRLLALASMMVTEIATDELSRPDKMPAADKEKAIEFFAMRLKSMTESGDINLTDVFGPMPDTGTIHQLDPHSEGSPDGGKRVA